ncbi:hypothetical protein MTO96_000890 [Rhipicephalus appendiculatus]
MGPRPGSALREYIAYAIPRPLSSNKTLLRTGLRAALHSEPERFFGGSSSRGPCLQKACFGPGEWYTHRIVGEERVRDRLRAREGTHVSSKYPGLLIFRCTVGVAREACKRYPHSSP